MKNLILVLIALFFTGCATSSLQTGPPYKDWKTGQKKFDAKIVLADTGFFTPSTADALLLECLPPEPFVATDVATGKRHVTPNDLEGEELLEVSRCQLQADIAHDTQTGAAASFVAPVLNSAAMVGGAYFIGKGIGDSGDRTTVNQDQLQKADAVAYSDSVSESDAHAHSEGGNTKSIACDNNCSKYSATQVYNTNNR